METPIEVLRVEASGISKELGRFRACDAETRSLYCREWAQYIYKKHFVWNAKTQEDMQPDAPTFVSTLKAGKYQINFLTAVDDQDEIVPEHVPKKERSNLLGKKFEDLAASWTSSDANNEETESLLTQIIHGCQLWMTLPSGYTGLPTAFEPVEFNPYPDAIPLVEDVKDPSQLLDPLIIERQALCLPSDCFHLLKNLTGDILLSHTTPTCNHSKPNSKTPADLELDRAIFNEHEANAITKALNELSLALETTWYPVNQLLEKLAELESRRSQLMGKGCQAKIDAFFASQKFVSFVDNWTKEATRFKNKKSTDEEIKKVDDLFQQHLQLLKTSVKQFMSEFVPQVLQETHQLTKDLWKMVLPTIYELGERMTKREAGKKGDNAAKIQDSLKILDMDYLKKMESTKEVDSATKHVTALVQAKVDDYMTEIDALFQLYKDTARNNLAGRLEKLNNKDFKKKIKKVESGYYSIRQTFRYEVTETIFPESLFCKFALVCLEPLLQEGEMVEALTIETEVKRFMEAYKDLWQQRRLLLTRFEEGVQTGRHELAGILGKLFLKEGMRIQGDNLALKRQNNLLKSMGMEVTEKPAKKKKNASGTVSPALVVPEPAASPKKPEPKKAAVKKSEVTPAVKTDTANAEPVPAKKVSAPVITTKPPVSPVSTTNAPTVKAPTAVKTPIATEFNVNSKAPAKVVSLPPSPAKPVVATPPPPPPPAPEAKKEVKKEVKPKPKPAPVAEPKRIVTPEPIKKSTEPRPKVKSSKIPAPAPIIEKIEPKVTVSEKKKKKVADKPKKKEESKIVEEIKLEEPKVVEEPIKVEESMAAEEPAKVKEQEVNDVQNWETIRASVNQEKTSTAAEPLQNWDDIVKSVEPVKQVESPAPVQNWNDVVKSVAEPVAETWNDVVKSEPVVTQDWDDVVKSEPVVTQDWDDVVKSVDAEKQEPQDWIQLRAQVEQPKENGTSKKSANDWPSTAATVASSETSSLVKEELGGWGTPKKSPALSTSNTSWSNNKAWNNSAAAPPNADTPWVAITEKAWKSPEKKPIAASPVWSNTDKTTGGWVTDEPKASTGWDTLGGWGSPSTVTWGEKKKTAEAAPSWDTTQKASSSNWDTNTPQWNNYQEEKKAAAPTMMIPENNIKPPGLSLSTATQEPVAAAMPPPGLSTASTPVGITPPVGLTPPMGLPSFGSNTQQVASPYQESLPGNLLEMPTETLALIIQNLHRENGNLISSVYAMQQEMSMMTTRYTEIMTLAREREAQTLQLFESRKQTEMEEARRYVLTLESKVKQLESASNTAGFQNQDLFAGYREEMRSTPSQGRSFTNNGGRKMWSKNPPVVRCGNCGEVGHRSAECKTNCRYCGSAEHLSEACPMN